MTNDQMDLATSPVSDSITLDQRLNSDLSLTSIPQQPQGSAIFPSDTISSCSNAHIFHTISTNNIGDTASCQIRTPRSSIILFDDHINDSITTYLLGPPQTLNEETNSVNLSSYNLATSISRAQLSNIDEEKLNSNDPYALVEPLKRDESSQSTLVINTSNTRLSDTDTSVNYADLLLPSQITNESSDINEQQQQPQQQQCINTNPDDLVNEITIHDEQEYENNERISTKLYADIDFQQTQRYDRIVQSAAKAKIDDQAPPFVL